MPELFKCTKCGKQLYNKHEQSQHEKECRGVTFNLDVLERLAKGESLEPRIGFDCVICGEVQIIPGPHNWGKEIVFPVCDNCKSDLKEIILLKRKKNGKA